MKNWMENKKEEINLNVSIINKSIKNSESTQNSDIEKRENNRVSIKQNANTKKDSTT